MISMRRAQLNFGDGLIADEVKDLCEDWMKHADEVLGDESLVTMVYEALARVRDGASAVERYNGGFASVALRRPRNSCPELFPNAAGRAMTRSGFEYILAKHVATAARSEPSIAQKTCVTTCTSSQLCSPYAGRVEGAREPSLSRTRPQGLARKRKKSEAPHSGRAQSSLGDSHAP
jgi:hypothetical protein